MATSVDAGSYQPEADPDSQHSSMLHVLPLVLFPSAPICFAHRACPVFMQQTPPNINDPAGISSWLSRMVRFYKDDWNVIFPEPNLKILTWRLCRSLACSRK